jgi:signal transduction histidine kinase
VIVLSALLLALCGLGGVVLYRMVSVRLEYAARRGDFVAAVSHELKTPLTSIRMMAEILRDGMVSDEARRQQYYQTITAEAERLSRLIGNVLTLARLERGAPSPERVVGDAGEVLRQAAEVLGPHAREMGFTLEVRVPPDLPPVLMDPDALLQVLVNLLDNALKFSAEAEDKRVLIEAHAEGAGVCITVRDHGPGVPPRQLRRIFEPFFRGERELTRRTRGTGIGLALVEGLVARMGGRIQAQNHPEGGLEVSVGLVGA